MCDPILFTYLKMQPHPAAHSHLIASYREVPLTPGHRLSLYQGPSLRSRRLEVVGARKNGRARGRLEGRANSPSLPLLLCVALSRARSLFRPHFQAPATQAVRDLKTM